MPYGQIISLNEVEKFNIESCLNNKYSLSVLVNGTKHQINEFEHLSDVHAAFLNILVDFDNGMTELYVKRGG